MLYATAGQPFEALADNAPTGLVGTITVEVYNQADGTSVLAPTTAGITEPRSGTYAASLTVATAGAYVVRWVTPDGTAEEPLTVSPVAATTTTTTPPASPADYRPSVDDLGALMRARTRIRGGTELGTFRDAVGGDLPTRPTATEVEEVIDRVLPAVSAAIGRVPVEWVDAARQAVIYRTAQLIELGFWPEQNDTDQSTAAQYQTLYTELVGTPKDPGPLVRAGEGDAPGAPNRGFAVVKTLGRDGLADPAPAFDPFLGF